MSGLVYTPVMVEEQTRRLLNRITAAGKEFDEAVARYSMLKDDLETAKAEAVKSAEGTVMDREAHVSLATVKLRHDFAAATAQYLIAKNRLDVLKVQLSGLQSIGRSVQQAYGAVGVVEP